MRRLSFCSFCGICARITGCGRVSTLFSRALRFNPFSLKLGKPFLLLAQFCFLARDQLGLSASLFRTTCNLSIIDNAGLGLLDFLDDRGIVTLDEGTLLSDLDLNSARLAAGIRLLDFRCFFTGQGDLFLLAIPCRAMDLAQMPEQLVLVFLG